MLNYAKIGNQSECLKHQDHGVSILGFHMTSRLPMLVYRTIAKKVFWEFDSIIMQNLSDIFHCFVHQCGRLIMWVKTKNMLIIIIMQIQGVLITDTAKGQVRILRILLYNCHHYSEELTLYILHVKRGSCSCWYLNLNSYHKNIIWSTF